MVVNADCSSWSILLHRFYLVKIVKRKYSPLCFSLILFIQFQWTDWFSCTIIQLNGREELCICIVFGKCKNLLLLQAYFTSRSFMDILQFPYLGGGLPLTFQGFIDYDMTIQNSLNGMLFCICHSFLSLRIRNCIICITTWI